MTGRGCQNQGSLPIGVFRAAASTSHSPRGRNMRRGWIVIVAAWLGAAAPAFGQSPQDALKQLPDDALGFVLVNNIDRLSTKLDSAAQRLKVPVPTTLVGTLQGALTTEGVNLEGSAMIVVLSVGAENPVGVGYLPVSNYKTFLRGL